MNKNKASSIIASYWKTHKYKINNLPNSIKYIQKILNKNNIEINKNSSDGRTNSSFDEKKIINILKNDKLLENRINIPKDRHWFDIAIYDYQYGWIPCNIKSSTLKSADNVGNLAMCLYALTNYKMNLNKSYRNNKIYKKLIDLLKDNELNLLYKRDYYFIVLNKQNNKVIVNSFKGLKYLTSNLSNLPFQIKWKENRYFIYQNIYDIKIKFLNVIQNHEKSWIEDFLTEFRKLK